MLVSINRPPSGAHPLSEAFLWNTIHMQYEEQTARFESGDLGIRERLALGLPVDAPEEIGLEALRIIATARLNSLGIQRSLAEPVDMNHYGILSELVHDITPDLP